MSDIIQKERGKIPRFFMIRGAKAQTFDMQGYEKVCVETLVRFSENGGMRPVEIIYDNARYPVTRVRFIDRAPARVSAVLPLRFTCEIGGRNRYLYYESEEMRWFVEKIVER